MTQAQENKYKELVESGELKTMRDKVYWIIWHNPKITSSGIRAFLGIKKDGGIAGRLAELQDRGLIKEVGIKDSNTQWEITLAHEIEPIINKRIREREMRHINALIQSPNIKNLTKQFLLADADYKYLNDKTQIDIVDNAITLLLKSDLIRFDSKLVLVEEWQELHDVDVRALSEQDKIEIIKGVRFDRVDKSKT